MHLRQPRLRLFPRVLEPLVIALALELSELRVQRGLLAQERVAPHVRLEHRVQRDRVVADNLLLDEEDGDVRGDGYVSHGDVSEERGFTDTVSTDEGVAAAICEREGRARPVDRIHSTPYRVYAMK